MRIDNRMDESTCKICLEKEQDIPISFFLDDEVIVCKKCLERFRVHKKTYRIHNVNYHILYEYDTWIEGLFFQFKEQRDIVLKDIFLYAEKDFLKKKLKSFDCIALCSGEEKRALRGFEPVLEIFKEVKEPIASPFYRTDSIKQSSLSKEQRKQIHCSLKKKICYPIRNRSRQLLLDDVITTGQTIKAALLLISCRDVLVLAAHPLWIEEHADDQIKHSFWK